MFTRNKVQCVLEGKDVWALGRVLLFVIAVINWSMKQRPKSKPGEVQTTFSEIKCNLGGGVV